MPRQFMTVVIEMPDDEAQREAIKNALPLFEDFHGGHVIAMYAGDATTENELLENQTSASVAARVRRNVAALSVGKETHVDS